MKLPFLSSLRSEFGRNVAKLFTSTVLANAIRALSLLAITRLFTPGDLGDFQKFLSLTTVFGMVAALKYEMAIVLPKERRDADRLAVATLLVLTAVTLGLGLAVAVAGGPLLALLNAGELDRYAGYIILGVALTGLLQIARFVLIRHKRFGDLARNKVAQSAVSQGGALLWGLLSPTFLALFLSHLAGILVSVLLVARRRLIDWGAFTRESGGALLKRYAKFPAYNAPGAFLNNLSLELPVFLFATWFDSTVIGYYMVANQAVILPLNLIGTSVQQVYYQAASEAYAVDPQRLLGIYIRTVRKLALVGIIPLAGIAGLSPFLAGPIFGEALAPAGIYMAILTLGMFFRFLNSPIAATFAIVDRQEVGLALIAASIVVRFLAIWFFRDDIIHALWALSGATALFYAAYNVAIYRIIRQTIRRAEADGG